jgi:hypothetical protein
MLILFYHFSITPFFPHMPMDSSTKILKLLSLYSSYYTLLVSSMALMLQNLSAHPSLNIKDKPFLNKNCHVSSISGLSLMSK